MKAFSNSSHYTITTRYIPDANKVQSTLRLSNVIPDNDGIYVCQCVYNSSIIEGIVTKTANFCLKVNASASSQGKD